MFTQNERLRSLTPARNTGYSTNIWPWPFFVKKTCIFRRIMVLLVTKVRQPRDDAECPPLAGVIARESALGERPKQSLVCQKTIMYPLKEFHI